MSLSTIFMLTIECPECGKIHKFSVDGIVEKGTIYCSCGKTIIVDNANQFVEKIDELEIPPPQVALSTKAEKKVEIEREEEKPKTAKPKAKDIKAEKKVEIEREEEKPKTAKPKAKDTKKKTTTKKPKKEETKK